MKSLYLSGDDNFSFHVGSQEATPHAPHPSPLSQLAEEAAEIKVGSGEPLSSLDVVMTAPDKSLVHSCVSVVARGLQQLQLTESLFLL